MGAIRGDRRLRTALCIAVATALVAVLCASDTSAFPHFARPMPDPMHLELAEGWSLSSARTGQDQYERTGFAGCFVVAVD